MTTRFGAALGPVLTQAAADCAVVWSRDSDSGIVLGTLPAGLLAEGDPWPHVGASAGVVTDPTELARLVPTSLRLRLPGPVAAAWSADFADSALAVLLVWERLPDQQSRNVVTAGLHEQVAATVRLWEAQRRSETENARLAAVVAALHHALVTVDDIRSVAFLNAVAADLLSLPTGEVPAAELALAMGVLQSRTVNTDEVLAQAARLLVDPRADLPPLVWEFVTAPTHLSVSSVAIRGQGQSGRVWVFEDVSADVALRAELERRARYDDLTGLLNRSEAISRAESVLSHPRRRGDHWALVFCDLDGFKAVNDAAGHAAGDQVLRVVARRMRAVVREGDLVARMGGDEMLVLLDGVRSIEDAERLADLMRVAIAEPINGGGFAELRVGASMGVTLAEPGDDIDVLIARADAAMYTAKREGRGRVVRV